MREIKFRAWDKKFNEWACICLKVGEGVLPTAIKDYVFMQYTGLLDKNGVEIYEGDILKMHRDFNAKVFYNLRFSSFEVATTGNSVGFYDKSEMEVIGNIYDNPELLENK